MAVTQFHDSINKIHSVNLIARQYQSNLAGQFYYEYIICNKQLGDIGFNPCWVNP